ncbi:MAG: hypothetical protein ABI573_08070 [Chloroflexota bacterium]
MPSRYTPADDRSLDRPDFWASMEPAAGALRSGRAVSRMPPAPYGADTPRSRVVSHGWRWLLNRQTGLIPRIRLAAGVLLSTVKARGPWRALPYDLATALFAPIRIPGPPAPAIAARDWSAERAAAAARLRRAAELWASQRQAAASQADERPAPLSLAVIADDDVSAWVRSGSVVELRPEDWAVVLEHAEGTGALPAALLVTSTIAGNHGAWAFRLGPFAHPDAFLQRDVAALVAWFAGRALPSIFLVTDDGADAVAEWSGVARLFDLILAPNEDAAARFSARPDRQGIEARVAKLPTGFADIRAAVEALT